MKEELWRGKSLPSSYNDALRRIHLNTGTAHGDLAGNNVIEIDRNYWRNIVVRIRIIRIAPAAGSPGQKKHQAKYDAAQRPMRKQKHVLVGLSAILGKTSLACLTQRDTHIVAESWRDLESSENRVLIP